MIDSLKSVFAIPDLRKRVLFTLSILAVYRVGSHVPTPGVNTEALTILAEQAAGTMFGLPAIVTVAERFTRRSSSPA